MKTDGVIGKNGVIGDESLLEGSFDITSGETSDALFAKNSSTVDDAVILHRGERFHGKAFILPDGSVAFKNDAGLEIPAEEIELMGGMLQNGSPLTAWAFQKGLSPIGNWGNYIVTIAVFLFAISTAISWSYYGDRSIEYLFGSQAILPYRVVFCIIHFLGAVFSLEIVWGFGDTALGLMAIPNLIAILALSGVTKRLTNDYFSRSHKRYKKSRLNKS